MSQMGSQGVNRQVATARSSIIHDPTGPISAPADGKCKAKEGQST